MLPCLSQASNSPAQRSGTKLGQRSHWPLRQRPLNPKPAFPLLGGRSSPALGPGACTLSTWRVS